MTGATPALLRHAAVLTVLLTAGSARAQLRAEDLKGDNGLLAGSQTPPGVTAIVMMAYYHASTLLGPNGDRVPSGSLDVVLAPLVGVQWVSTRTFADAHWGICAAVAGLFESNFLSSQAHTRTYGWGDAYVRPVQLGWHFARADFLVGYAVFIPSGQFREGAADNLGLGLWTHELSAGTTVYLDAARTLSVATLALYESHAGAAGNSPVPGSHLTLEGGVGKEFPSESTAFTVGAVYYAQWKLTGDLGAVEPAPAHGQSIAAVGLEGVVHFKKSSDRVSLRALQEFGGKNTTRGQFVALTYSHVFAAE